MRAAEAWALLTGPRKAGIDPLADNAAFTRDLLYPDSVDLAERARAAGVQVELISCVTSRTITR